MGSRHGWCAGLVLASSAWILPAQTTDPAAFLTQARAAYYSEAREHMNQYQSSLEPDWSQLLTEQNLAPDTRTRAVARLADIRFALVLDRQGAATISHQDVAPASAQEASGLKQVYEGMEQMVTGFFQTWSVFMIHPPLPEPGTPFKLERLGAWQVVSYQEGESRIEVTLGQDFAASEVKVLAKDFNSTIHPSFVKTGKGFVLVGYQATYRSAQAAEATDLTVTLENQDLAGCTVPAKMDLRGSYGGSPFHITVRFLGGRVTKR